MTREELIDALIEVWLDGRDEAGGNLEELADRILTELVPLTHRNPTC